MAGQSENREFRRALARFASEERRYAVRGALSILLAAALAAFSMLLTLEFRFPAWRLFPLAAFVIFWGSVAGAAVLAALRGLLTLRGEGRLAAELDRRGASGNLVTAAHEFSKGGERIRAYSPYLVAATIRRAAGRLGALDPRSLFGERGEPAWTVAGIILGILVAVQVAFLHGEPGRVLAAISDPALSFRLPHGYNLVVVSGSRFVLPGEDVTAEAVNFGARRGEADLLISSIPGVWNRIKVAGAEADTNGVRVSLYRHRFNDVREDFSYAFSAGGVRTPDYRVTVLHRPVINGMAAVVSYPAYAHAKPDTIEPLAGKIVALGGSRVTLTGETSMPVRSAALRFTGGHSMPATPRPGGFTGSFTVAGADTFVVEIIDSMGLANDRGVRYPVVALEDRAPTVELLAPEDKAKLPRTLTAELLYRASDDYGIARLDLEFLRDGKDETFTRVALPVAAGAAGGEQGAGGVAAGAADGRPVLSGGGQPTELAGRFEWSLAGAGVVPGDRILYYVEVFDNNTATGPGHARTETRTLVVPSMAEIYAQIHEETSAQRENLENVLDKGREIKERLAKLSDELKTSPKLDWSRKRESADILEKQRELQDKMREITSQIDHGLNDIEKNRAASREIADKVGQIQDLLKQIQSTELKNLMENLKKLMNELSPKDLMAVMNEVQLDTDKLIQNMDRTIELLKQVIKEERMDEFSQRLDEILKEQAALRDSTPRGDTKELSKRQEDLGKESGRYEKDMNEFAKEASDSSLASELSKLMEEMRQKKLAEQMQRSASELSEGDRAAAQSCQSKSMGDLLSLYTSLSRCQMSMGVTMEQEVIQRLAQSARELVEVSKLQEGLAIRLHEPFGRSQSAPLLKDEIVVKDALQKITDNLYQVARKSMSLSPAVFMTIGMADKDIDIVLKGLEDEQPSEADAAASRAYRSINLAVIELLRSSSSAGGASASGRQRLQQLMQQQMSLGQELKRLLEGGNAGQWSMEERAAMARLAGEQRKMEDLLKQIAAESAGTGELMGKLDDVTKQMEDMAKDLEQGKLTNELVERQEHIMTRMLDSQRSMRERDFKKERTSTAAGEVKALAPDAWNQGADRSEVLLQMIRKAMQEKGPAEYEDLIRQYFRALSEKAREAQ